MGSQKAVSVKRTCTDLSPKNPPPIPYSTGCILFGLHTETGTVATYCFMSLRLG